MKMLRFMVDDDAPFRNLLRSFEAVLELPNIAFLIFQYLDFADICRLSCVSRSLNEFLFERSWLCQTLWKQFSASIFEDLQHFKNERISLAKDDSRIWKNVFKNKWRASRRKKKTSTPLPDEKHTKRRQTTSQPDSFASDSHVRVPMKDSLMESAPMAT